MDYRCGRCGYEFTATSQEEYAKLHGEHTGVRCLAVLGRLTPDQIDYLANDLARVAKTIPRCTVRELLQLLHNAAEGGRKQSNSPGEGAPGESVG